MAAVQCRISWKLDLRVVCSTGWLVVLSRLASLKFLPAHHSRRLCRSHPLPTGLSIVTGSDGQAILEDMLLDVWALLRCTTGTDFFA